MEALRIETTLSQDGVLKLNNLPLRAGQPVEVIILATPTATTDRTNRYPLRGTPVTYLDPTEPVADADWEAGQ